MPPPDFSLIYHWCEGAMPPPYYYEYEIHIGTGEQAKIVFSPDYPQHDTPVWEYRFQVSQNIIDDIYAQLENNNAMRTDWPVIEDPPIGDSLNWLTFTANNTEYKIPLHLQSPQEIEAIYADIRATVPRKIWDDLMTCQAEYGDQ